MRHIAFYYATGFAVAGFSLLILTAMTFAGISPAPRDPEVCTSWNMTVLSFTAVLPFAISMLSWREWKRLQNTETANMEA